MENTVCSLCSSESAETLIVLHDYGHNIPGQFPLVRCRVCGLMYLTPRPQPTEISKYYPDNYAPYKTAIEDEHFTLMRWKRRQNIGKYRRVIERFAPAAPKFIVDLGCSTGIFLSEMRSAGWKVQGIELSSSAVHYARERYKLEVFQGRLVDVYEEIPAASVSAVTMWDVLEHTYDPLRILQIINTRMISEGVVVITIPHWESLDRKLFGEYWIGYDAPRHLYVFTQDVLRKLLMLAGFEILQMRCLFGGYYTTLPSFLHWMNANISSTSIRKMIHSMLNIPGIRFITLPFDTLLEALGLGNKLLVIAKKVKTINV
jgi:2-polyprenyl-3-methyl-5-hydroxy-6-metoxy-1,4-benzoquinol methylase